MSRRGWRQRVADMVEAMEEVRRLAGQRTPDDLAKDTVLFKALLYNFAVIGGAARRVPDDLCERHPEIDGTACGP